MTDDEYKRRRQQLDDQLRSAIELLVAAHRQQVHALDLVRMTMTGREVSLLIDDFPPVVRQLLPEIRGLAD